MEGSAGRAGDWGTPQHMAESPGVRWEGYGVGTLDDRPPTQRALPSDRAWVRRDSIQKMGAR